SSDPDTKQITVIADDETAQYIKQVIHGLDRPKPQVLIKVVFLEVTYNNASDIGIEGNITGKLRGPMTGPASNIFGLLSSGAAPVPPGAGLYTILGKDFSATLRLIAQAGKPEILSRQSVGVILQVTPFITPEGLVEMIVSPQISELADRSQWVPISSGPSGSISAPGIKSRPAHTVVGVAHAQTVIIGGLMETDKTSTDSKIPILGDIPFIGNAFKRQTKSYTKSELIIFLTPHIVTQPSQLLALSASDKANSQLLPKAFSEQELDRFLDTLPVKRTKAGSQPTKSAK